VGLLIVAALLLLGHQARNQEAQTLALQQRLTALSAKAETLSKQVVHTDHPMVKQFEKREKEYREMRAYWESKNGLADAAERKAEEDAFNKRYVDFATQCARAHGVPVDLSRNEETVSGVVCVPRQPTTTVVDLSTGTVLAP